MLSKVGSDSGYLTYSQLMETLYARNFQFPYIIEQDANGKITFELYSGQNLPLVFKSRTGGPLPMGAVVRVFETKTGRNVPVNNRLDIQLAQTDKNGVPKGFVNAQPITTGEASYCYIFGLPKGSYYAKAYYGEKEISSPINFDFPVSAC